MSHSVLSREPKKINLFISALCLSLIYGCVVPVENRVSGEYFSISSGKPVQLTSGVDNDTEAAWSPDGEQIAFQRERNGDLDIEIINLSCKEVSPLVSGDGLACYPAWTPDGAVIYSFSERGKKTASEICGKDMNCGFGLRMVKDGRTEVLSEGLWRDYCASVSPDGKTIYFSSTRECSGNNSSLWKMPLADPSQAECMVACGGRNEGISQPVLSPDGKVLLWSELNGFYSNWRLAASFKDTPHASVKLSYPEMSAYAPAWSPDGRFVAFTGFRSGDLSWRIYVMEMCSGEILVLDTGPGNSKSPKWSPDGKELVFENNSKGNYDLYRIPVQCVYTSIPLIEKKEKYEPAVTAAILKRVNGKAVLKMADGDQLAGVYSKGLDPAQAVEGTMPVGFSVRNAIDYGLGLFYVRVKFRLDSLAKDTRIAAVGSYKQHQMAWQVFVRPDGRIMFNSRDKTGRFIGVESNRRFKPGESVTVVGVRDADGSVNMWVDGIRQRQTQEGADFNYVEPLKINLGQQYHTKQKLDGVILEFESGHGWPPGIVKPPTRASLFMEVAQ